MKVDNRCERRVEKESKGVERARIDFGGVQFCAWRDQLGGRYWALKGGTLSKQSDCSIHSAAVRAPLQMHHWGAPAWAEHPVDTVKL